MSKVKYDLSQLNFTPVKRLARYSTTLQKEIATDLKKTGVFDQNHYRERAEGYIKELMSANAGIWGDGFEEERQLALVWMWEMYERIQNSKAPSVEAERAESWKKQGVEGGGADREAYESATFITLEEAEREGI